MYGVDFCMDEGKRALRLSYWRRASVMVLFSLILIILIWQSQTGEQETLNQTAEGTKAVVVIDPGHGGMQDRPKKVWSGWE